MSVYKGWGTIDLKTALVAGVQSAASATRAAWWPLWDLPVGAKHGDLVRVVVEDGLAVIDGCGEEALERLRAEYRRGA